MQPQKFNVMKRILFFCLGLSLACFIQAQTRIAVVADPHVLATSLFDDGTAFENAKSSNARLIEYSQFLFDSAMTIIAQQKPDMLFLVGDMANEGEKASHEHIVAKLQALKDLGIQPIVIPGNNDIANKNAYAYSGNTKSKVPSVTEAEYTSLYAPFGLSQAVSRETDGLSYMVYPNDHLALICFNSAKPNTATTQYNEGGLYESTIVWAEQAAKQAKDQGRMILALMHHQATNHFNMEDEMTPSYIANTTSGYPELEQMQSRLLAAGVEVIFTGHYHMTSIKHTLNTGKQLYDVGTGSLSSYPSPIRWLTLSNNGQLAITTQLIDTYHTLELERNANTAQGIINRVADMAFPKMEEVQTSTKYQLLLLAMGLTFDDFNLPKTKAQMIEDLAGSMLPSMTLMVNELSRGDEDTRTPQEHLDSCMRGFDNYVTHTICRDNEELGVVLLALVKEYRDMLYDMCHSVFFNYVGEDETMVVADNTNTLQIAPSTVTGISSQHSVFSIQKFVRDGQIYIQRNGHTYDIIGHQLD